MKNKICGIYCIENLIDGKKYIGQAININNRIKDHKRNFKKECFEDTCTENRYLWYAVKKHKIDNFDFYVIEFCDIEYLDIKETYYIKKLKSHVSENGYNILWGGFTRLGTHHTQETKDKISSIHKGKVVSEETRGKMSESATGRKVGEETRRKLSENHSDVFGEKNPMFGKRGKHSPLFGRKASAEERRKISESKLGVKRSQSVIDKLKLIVGEKHWFFGGKHTEETKNKMSKSSVGKKHGLKGTSRYLGVSYYSKLGKWKVSITVNRKQIYIGVFEIETVAAKEYDKISWKSYKDLSKLNFPEDYK